jgi:kinetochore protein Spc24
VHLTKKLQLIANCIENFNIAPDRASLKRTNAALTHLTAARMQILQRHQSGLHALNRNLTTLQSTHALTVQSHNPASHAGDILRLDTEKFRIAKEASEAELEGERLEKDVESARRTLAELGEDEEGGVAGKEALDDEMLLKLKVYRMLNIDVEPDAETGLYTRAVVRNPAKGDVHVVNVDPKFSRYFYANYFWSTL